MHLWGAGFTENGESKALALDPHWLRGRDVPAPLADAVRRRRGGLQPKDAPWEKKGGLGQPSPCKDRKWGLVAVATATAGRASATAAAIGSPATAATAWGTFFAWPRNIDGEGTTCEFFAV